MNHVGIVSGIGSVCGFDFACVLCVDATVHVNGHAQPVIGMGRFIFMLFPKTDA